MKRIARLFPLLTLLFAAPVSAAEVPAAWQNAVARMIAQKQTYPRSAQIRGEEGTTRLRITLAADGRINGVDLAASSGSAILDHQAESVVTSIGKLPRPPAGVSTLFIPIVWRLN